MLRRRRFLTLAVALPLLLLSGERTAAAQKPGVSPSDLPAATVARIEAAVRDAMAKQNIPGLSIAVVTGGRLRWATGYGRADLENDVPATAKTVYRLGSISKPITAVAVMQLAEKGKLDLDAPIQKYVPTFPEKPWPVTARRLLGHLAGVRHYSGGPSEFNSTRHYTDLTATLGIFKTDPLRHEPGTKYLYSTYGYSLLGAAVEGASAGTPFADYLRENVWKPAGMDTLRVDDVFALIPHRAQGYRKALADGALQNSPLADTSNKIPGGGLCGTASDLARFAIALMEDNKLVSAQTRARMWTRQKTSDGKESVYGLGWALGERNGIREVHHGGAQQRITTFLYLLPEKKTAVAIMTNLENAQIRDLARAIADTALEK